jgi:hypothetical protein
MVLVLHEKLTVDNLSGNTDPLMEFKVHYTLKNIPSSFLPLSQFDPFCYIAPPPRFILILLNGL